MKSKLTVSAWTIVVCVLLGGIPAQATTIEIGVATQTGISNITTEATGTGSTGATYLGAYDNYGISASASDSTPIDLGSATINISGGSTSPLYLYVTETGLTSLQSAESFQSQFTALLPEGWTETETTYLDTANAAYGEGTKLASMTGAGTENVTTTEAVQAGSPFSLTEVYEFISNGLGIDVSTESIQVAPAPSIGSGVPAMLAVGAMLLGTKLLARWRRS